MDVFVAQSFRLLLLFMLGCCSFASTVHPHPHPQVMNVSLDIESVFAREGDAPLRQLQAALGLSTGSPSDAMAASDSTAPAAHEVLMSAEELEALRKSLRGVVWTRSMRRMYTLAERCVRHMEPVLLVGETGVGKTTVVQALALMRGQRLHAINVNQHTEAADLIGGFRPARGRSRALAAFATAAAAAVANPLLAAAAVAAPVVHGGCAGLCAESWSASLSLTMPPPSFPPLDLDSPPSLPFCISLPRSVPASCSFLSKGHPYQTLCMPPSSLRSLPRHI